MFKPKKSASFLEETDNEDNNSHDAALLTFFSLCSDWANEPRHLSKTQQPDHRHYRAIINNN